MMASPFTLAWMVLKDATELYSSPAGPTIGEMADMSPEEKKLEMEIARRRAGVKGAPKGQKTLHDFGG